VLYAVKALSGIFAPLLSKNIHEIHKIFITSSFCSLEISEQQHQTRFSIFAVSENCSLVERQQTRFIVEFSDAKNYFCHGKLRETNFLCHYSYS
jgi:hypothetical protein